MTAARNVTERVRLCRRRRRDGEMVLPPIAIPFDAVDVLAETGHLGAWDADDPKKVAEAVEQYFRNIRRVDIA